jgi:hypothetical protein
MDKVGRITGYAWSQSLGWVNFGGVYAMVKINIPASVNRLANCPISDPTGVCGCVGPDTSSLNFDSFFSDLEPYPANGVRVADGEDFYTVSLYFHDQNGNPIPRSEFANGHYEAKIIFKWEDTIKRNQTTSLNNTVGLGDQSLLNKISKPFNNSSKGAVTYKPVLLYTPNGAGLDVDSTYEAGITDLPSKEKLLDKWTSGDVATFKITSVAPTTDGNLSKIIGSTKGFVENENFSTFDNPPATGLERNGLKLVSIDWTIKDTTPGGAIITGTSLFDADHGTLKYKPALAIKTLDGGNDEDTLWMYRNVPVGVEMEGVDNKTNKENQEIINTGAPLTMAEFNVVNESEFEVGFTKSSLNDLKDPQNQKIESISTADFIRVISGNILDNLPFQLEATIPISTIDNTDKTLLPGNYAEGAGLYSMIKYKANYGGGTKDLLYFSNHLPRTISTAVSNPAVVIQGTTYSQGSEVTSVQEGINITGIGDQNVNVVRDLIFENIQKLLIDQSVPKGVGSVKITSLNPPCSGANGCLKIELEKERIFYFNSSNVILNSGGADIEPSDKNTVMIVDGGDFHVESNLYTTDVAKKKLKTGIVALRRDDLGQGNIYIGPDVTNIQALMIADGTLFSAPNFGAGGFTTTKFGEPQDNMDPTVFNKQLIIEGGVSSRNCIGCVDSANNSYFLPQGPLTKNDVNKETAKKYDLNYLRYFSLELAYDPETGNPIDQQCGKALTPEEIQTPPAGCNGIDPTSSIDDDGDLIPDSDLKAKNAGDKTNPVYIKYVPPSADSFVFSKEKSLTF